MVRSKETTRKLEVSDPHEVPEIFVSGPFNITRMGNVVVFTYTVVRPDTGEVFAGSTNPPYKGVVAARIVMLTSMAEDFARVLARTLDTSDRTAGSA